MTQSLLKSVIMLVAGALILGGCGVRGALENPPEAKAETARAATADAAQGKPEGATRRPHQGFILDGLLR